MSKARQKIQGVAAFAVMIIGAYMLVKYDWPEPPAVSGLGFLLAGFALWTPHCMLLGILLKDKKEPAETTEMPM